MGILRPSSHIYKVALVLEGHSGACKIMMSRRRCSVLLRHADVQHLHVSLW